MIVLGGLSTIKTDVVDPIEIMAKYYTKGTCSDAKRHNDSEPALLLSISTNPMYGKVIVGHTESRSLTVSGQA